IVAATFTDSPIEITRWFNKIKRRKIRKKDKTTGELKASVIPDKFLEYYYQHVAKDLNFSIYAIVINKKYIPPRLKNEEGLIYLKAIEKLVEISKTEIDQTMFWYFDRRTLKNISWDLIKQSVRNKLILLSAKRKYNFEIHQTDSKRNINLQFADFIAYAIFRSKCMSDSRWINLIKKHVKRVDELNLR
ncbi:MAG: hypothetical protein UT11_C0027G0001, partial [Berkelbacteria bacterium GW2011_GWA2_38_9]